jgi:PKD repeat protein
MKKRLFVGIVSILLVLGFTLPGPALNVSAELFQSPPPPAPANDNFADAIVIYEVPTSYNVDTASASLESGEPTPTCAQGSSWAKSVWYVYTPGQSGPLNARVETGFAYGLAAYTGASLDSLMEVGSACEGARLTFQAEADTTYYFQVGGRDGDGGFLSLYLQIPLPNDEFANAEIVSGLPYYHSMVTFQASLEPGEPTPSCAQGFSWGKSVWYAYTPEHSSLVKARTDASFYPGLGVYTGMSLDSLTEVGSTCWEGGQITFNAEAGTTYYFQVGAMYGDGGSLWFYLEGPPPNDNFANAIPVSSLDLPYSHSLDTDTASLESGEPVPSCAQYSSWGKSIWYAFTPSESTSISATAVESHGPVVAAYTGSSLADLRQVGCANWWSSLTFLAEAGTTYYFQVAADWGPGGWVTFYLRVTPSPQASFYYSPSDPSAFDTVQFYDGSWDPAGIGFASWAWDFGDGATGEGCCPTHRYTADGDYAVQLTVTTYDGRTASTTQTVSVRTHDVAITKMLAPSSARVGQTRTIVAGINSKRYRETVQVELFKSIPGGYEWVGALRQLVPVRPANRTTEFSFSYTFTAADAQVGKVTFKATASIVNARDALPADNEAIALPTRVTR